MCIFPVWLSLTEETMRQVPHRITCRRVQRLTGSWSFPFRTLYVPDSCTRSELSMLWGFPGTEREREGESWFVSSVDLDTSVSKYSGLFEERNEHTILFFLESKFQHRGHHLVKTGQKEESSAKG